MRILHLLYFRFFPARLHMTGTCPARRRGRNALFTQGLWSPMAIYQTKRSRCAPNYHYRKRFHAAADGSVAFLEDGTQVEVDPFAKESKFQEIKTWVDPSTCTSNYEGDHARWFVLFRQPAGTGTSNGDSPGAEATLQASGAASGRTAMTSRQSTV